ncbi:MAG: 4Fe-4S binding protein [Deltaproteobacteria bacterium]|nr:4Fe-4S binding protein [Deltaproteobacteria bacterium]
MNEKQIYNLFIDWLSQSWIKVAKSSYRMPMIKARYTVEEAEFLTGFPFRKTKVEELAAMKEMSVEELEEKLAPMVTRGLVWKDYKKGPARYGLNDVFMQARTAFWREPTDDLLKNLVPAYTGYHSTGFNHMQSMTETKGLRTLPIQATIEVDKEVRPYEDVVKVLDNFEFYTVSNCPCRVRREVDPMFETSKKPLEVCLHFDDLGRYIIEAGIGREITREETEAILKKSADAGLVHAVSNWKEKPDTICNCDKEYCMFFEPYHIQDHHKSLDSSNFELTTESETCKGCGLCVKRCPLDALTMVDYNTADRELNKKGRVPQLAANTCIGCGVCVVKCPTQSLVLKEKAEVVDPPENTMEWTMRYMADVQAGVPKLRKTDS